MSAIGDVLKKAGGDALTGIIEAKKQGQKLPKALDKLATIGIAAEKEGIDIAKERAKEKAMEYLPWVIAAILLVLILTMYFRR